MTKEELLKYGNELTIVGFVVGNAHTVQVIMFPNESVTEDDNQSWKFTNDEDIRDIIRQMDVQEIEGLQKVILRKSQRNIDQKVAWQVFRRDNFTCVYCGDDKSPMTIDHIILWELMGDTVPDNLNCSCKKCNKTRGSMDYVDWMKSDYYVKASANISSKQHLQNHDILMNALNTAPRKTKRSR